jgi:triacylglycerol esterase/lipase EstA (alpha/beta hydrolase family)
MFVGAVTTAAMHLAHDLNWNFATTCILGMLLAMAIQMPLAWLVAPVLGSIESMLPSMVLVMVSPMSVCAAHLMGCKMPWFSCAGLGAAFGVGMFVIIQTQSRVYRRTVYLAHLCR